MPSFLMLARIFVIFLLAGDGWADLDCDRVNVEVIFHYYYGIGEIEKLSKKIEFSVWKNNVRKKTGTKSNNNNIKRTQFVTK